MIDECKNSTYDTSRPSSGFNKFMTALQVCSLMITSYLNLAARKNPPPKYF